MLNFLANSRSSQLFIALLVSTMTVTAITRTIPTWLGAVLLVELVLSFYVVSEMFYKFRQQPLHPWDAVRFSFFGFLAMFPVVLLGILPFAPFYMVGMQDPENPIVSFLLSPFIVFAKCWYSVGISLSVYDRDQVGAMGRSKNLIKNHFRDFALLFVLIAAFVYYEIAIDFFIKKETWLNVVLVAPFNRFFDCFVIPYMCFENFKKYEGADLATAPLNA